MSNLAPGAYVEEVVTPSFTASSTSTMTPVFIGAHQQGPTVPVLVGSWSEFVARFGGFGAGVPSNLALGVYGFFNNGGGQCYVLRVVHVDAVAATGSITDAGAAATLGVTAANPGAWGNAVEFQTTVNPDGTFNLIIYSGGTAPANVVERWTGLSMSMASNRYAPAVVNDPNTGSDFVTITDLHGTPAVPGNTPAAEGPTALGVVANGSTAGADGGVPVAADFVATTTALNGINGPIVINVPGVSDATGILNPLINYCDTQRTGLLDAMLVPDPPAGENVAGMLAFAATLTPSSYAAGPYYPWLVVSDPASTTKGARRVVPPGAYALGQWASTDVSRGVQKAPAGVGTTLSALDLQTRLSSADIGNLTAANVNCIRALPGAGICIWGARTLASNTSVKFVPLRRLLIEIEASALALTNFATFEPNDTVTWSQIALRLNAYLSKLYAQGAFAGTTAAESYFVLCDETINHYQSDTVNVQIGVALASPAEFILISLSQGLGGGSATSMAPSGVAIS